MTTRRTGGEGGALSVTELTRRVKGLLEEAFPELWVRGEVSNFRIQSSGHAYFTLKDEGAQLPAVMFRGDLLRSPGVLREGARVSAFGRLSVYEPRGAYQFVVRAAIDDGVGRLRAEFEALKARLAAEGLFDSERKSPLPRLPRTVGIVTSPTGAALQDFFSVLRRRGWKGRVILFPARVQGDGAAAEIAARIRDAADCGLLDTLVVGRGGGSLEDLWCFNEEVVARAIAACALPVISAVGHETDVTLADFVADRRAETPTAAAELISSLRLEAEESLESAAESLERPVEDRFGELGQRLDWAESRLSAHTPKDRLHRESLRLDALSLTLGAAIRARLASATREWDRHAHLIATHTPHAKLARASERVATLGRALGLETSRRLASTQESLVVLEARLRATGVDATLKRGFAIVRSEAGDVISHASEVTPGRPLKLRFADGEAGASGTGPASR